jgi:inosose dehydratase
MSGVVNRREFLAAGYGATTLAALRQPNGARSARGRREDDIHFGYAAITWNGNDRQAIDDISAVGFRGIQLRTSAVTQWGDDPAALRELLASHDLTFVALSSGVMRLDPRLEADDMALHLRHAGFVRAAGGMYLQLIDERPQGRAVTSADYRRMGGLLTELGRRTADLGIPLGYHNHMGTLGQTPEQVASVLEAADPRFVKLELDIAHYVQAGGDPANAVTRFAERLLFVHVKDVERPLPHGGPSSYRFVELGRGRVDLPAFFNALRRIGFRGWAIVELDEPVDPARSAKQSAAYARSYLEINGFRVR